MKCIPANFFAVRGQCDKGEPTSGLWLDDVPGLDFIAINNVANGVTQLTASELIRDVTANRVQLLRSDLLAEIMKTNIGVANDIVCADTFGQITAQTFGSYGIARTIGARIDAGCCCDGSDDWNLGIDKLYFKAFNSGRITGRILELSTQTDFAFDYSASGFYNLIEVNLNFVSAQKAGRQSEIIIEIDDDGTLEPFAWEQKYSGCGCSGSNCIANVIDSYGLSGAIYLPFGLRLSRRCNSFIDSLLCDIIHNSPNCLYWSVALDIYKRQRLNNKASGDMFVNREGKDELMLELKSLIEQSRKNLINSAITYFRNAAKNCRNCITLQGFRQTTARL